MDLRGTECTYERWLQLRRSSYYVWMSRRASSMIFMPASVFSSSSFRPTCSPTGWPFIVTGSPVKSSMVSGSGRGRGSGPHTQLPVPLVHLVSRRIASPFVHHIFAALTCRRGRRQLDSLARSSPWCSRSTCSSHGVPRRVPSQASKLDPLRGHHSSHLARYFACRSRFLLSSCQQSNTDNSGPGPRLNSAST
jgi:hypothetical protein